MVAQRDHHLFVHGVGKEQRVGILRQIAHLLADFSDRAACGGCAVEQDRARLRADEADETLEEGRLAGAVAAHERHDLAGPGGKVDATQDGAVAELDGELLGVDVGGAGVSW